MDFEKFGVERFTGSNYVTWSTKITFYLKLKGFYGALIDAPPPGNDADAAPARDAARDDKALAAIVLSVDNKILPLIQTCTTAKEAWDKLANMYHTQNTASIVRFKRELSTLAKGNTETITAFAGRAYALKDNLISAGATVDDMDISLAMLDKLPSAYEVTKKIIMSKKPFPTLEEVISELLTVEAQTPANTEKAYFATAPRPKFKPLNKTFNPRFNKPFNPRAPMLGASRFVNSPRPFNGGGSPGGNRPCFGASKDAKDVCYYCKKPGHFIGECRERAAVEARKGTPDTERREVAWTATTLAPDYDNPDYACTWFIDSGAERHITNDAGDLNNPKPCSTKVIVGTGEVVAAELEGDAILHESNVISRRIVLRRVLYIPGFAAKLVSIKMAKLAGATFIMEGNKCAVRMGGETIVTAIDAPNGIPCIVSNTLRGSPSPALIAKEAPEVWHARLGHLGYANLERAAKHGMVTGMDLTTTDFKALPMCEPCVMGKTTRLPFGESATVYDTPLALVSMDVCGPMTELSYGGAKYAATFIDHATGYSIVRTLKSKADVTPAVKEVLTYMEKQTDAHVKAVRTDNGSDPGGSPPPAPSPAPESNDNMPAPTAGGTDSTTGGTITRSGRVSRKPGEWWNAAAAAHYAGQVLPDPATRTEALGRLDASKWDDAMNEEIAAHVANNTWELDVPPAGVKIIPTKWVLTTKTDLAGNIERYKGRIVAKGFHQIEGIDYDEVFAPVGKYATLRAVLALAAAHDYEIIQIDIKNAFLQGNLEEEVWISQPEGYDDGSGRACRLIKALYGLKQAPRAWHSRLHEELTKMGFAPSKADASLYVGTSGAYILIYVDDILIIARNCALAESVKAELFAAFKTRDLGEVSQYLGMHITRDRINKTIKITNEKMVTELVFKYGLADCAPRDIPVSLGTKLTKDNGDPLDTAAYPYTSLVGALLYLSITVRPDIAFAVSALTRFMSCPTTVHWGVAKGVLRYLAGTTNIGIIYGGIKGSLDLNGMCDSDYAADLDTRRSTTGYVFTLNGGAITWSSKKQQTVAASTTEAEYMAASAAVKEALWLRKLMSDLKVNIGAIDILSDNQGAIKLLRNPVSSQRSKHIDVAHHFARERVARGEVTFHYVPTADNIADALTKPLALSKFVACRTGMGMV
ncbi:Retrovirus-related Pol polyprotein from transposon TNT 1-94 [Scenedesmus sp. PABB004]|nr:Retrovirus-related Pol polyprotein from transposon TNT 1-94 [Scenedesmus sp. PABB004]